MNTVKHTSSYSNIDQSDDPKHWVKLMADFSELSDVKLIRKLMLEMVKSCNAQFILDAGCGRGDTTRELSKTFPNANSIIGVDLSETMLNYAAKQTNANNVSFKQANVTQLPFADNSFDLIRIERVLHHVNDIEKTLEEIRRVLKAEGHFVICEPDFTMSSIYPLEKNLNLELGQRLSASIANGSIGAKLHELLLANGFTIKDKKAIAIILDDFNKVASTTQFIEVLKILLHETNNNHCFEAITKAADNKTFYFSVPLHIVLAQKI